jgi:hypothetical protein
MLNVSLARIMYGTNEDLHAGPSARTGYSSSLGIQVALDHSVASATREDSLGELLHKAWLSFKNKN